MKGALTALLLAAPLLGQSPNGWAPVENGWAEIQVAAPTGTVTTTGTLAAGQVALGSGATSITSDSGCTWTGTGASFALTIGGDTTLSRYSANTLRTSGALTAASSITAEANMWAMGRLIVGPGADIYLSRASAGTLLFEDGSGNPRDLQARTGTFGTSVVTPTVSGGADSATPNATFVTGTGSRGGTDTNTAGGNLTVRPGAGTGSATGSSLIFQTPTATGSGTTAQTQTTRLTLTESAATATVPILLPDGSASAPVLARSGVSNTGFYWTSNTLSYSSLGVESVVIANDNGGAVGVKGTLPYFSINSVQIFSASGSPETVVTAAVGSLFLRTDGGAGTTLYVKESGSGNTGWVAK